MYWHLSIIFILFLLSLNKKIVKNRKVKLLIFSLLIFYFSFKYRMGGDWYNYQSFYEYQIPEIMLSDIIYKKIFFERGFVILNYIFYNLGFNYEFFQGTVLSICYYFILNYIYKKSDNYFYSIAFLLTTSFHHYVFEPFFRQLIAIAIFLYALEYIEKNILKYFLFIFIAAQFHVSAYIFLGFYFIKYFRIDQKTFIYYLIPVYIFITFAPYLIENLSFFSRYSKYIEREDYFKLIPRTFSQEVKSVVSLFIRIYLITFSYGLSKKKDSLIEKMAIIFCILSYFINRFPIAQRLQGYFLFSYVISMSSLETLCIYKYKIKQMASILSTILIILVSYILIKNVYNVERGIAKYRKYNNYIILLLSGGIEEETQERLKLKEYFIYTQEMEDINREKRNREREKLGEIKGENKNFYEK